MRWFRVWYGGRLSKFAHLFAVDASIEGAGAARTACGKSPYEQFENAAYLAFVPAGEDAERCPECSAVGP